MKRIVTVLIFFILSLSCGHELHAQATNLNTTSSPTTCYNDGVLVVSATGGVGPYTYQVISGPGAPNIIYPLNPVNRDTFLDMTHGTFTVMVTDAMGQVSYFAATVGGTYQFPGMNFMPISHGVVAQAYDGRPPYRYALSLTGPGSGFSPFQASDTFKLCPGDYWIRMMDSCSNIYTAEYIMPDSNPMSVSVTCANFASGNFILTASGGTPPYTFGVNTVTNHTGIFQHVPSTASSAYVGATDSCGRNVYFPIYPTVMNFSTKCPYDEVYYGGVAGTLDITCTNCNPFQSHIFTDSSGPILTHMIQDSSYHIIITDSVGRCGIDTLPFNVNQPILGLQIRYNSCHSFTAILSDSLAQVDSFTVFDSHSNAIATNQTGYFYDMPDTSFEVVAYIHTACASNPVAQVTVPFFNIDPCYDLMVNSSCGFSWMLGTSPPSPESYFLLDMAGDTILPLRGDTFYYLIPQFQYLLVSDSGCHVPLVPPQALLAADATSIVSCVGGVPQISFNVHSNGCPGYMMIWMTSPTGVRTEYILPNYNGTLGPIIVSDTGVYTYQLFLWGDSTQPGFQYDSICPTWGGSVYVTRSPIPYPYPNWGYVCYPNTSDSITFHIYGGNPPYTVDVLGYPQMTLTGNSGIFPTTQIGTYTMIAYDDCGVSRSYSFSVIDTCHCNMRTAIQLPTTDVCAGSAETLTNASLDPAIIYQWYVNGQLYSQNPDTIYTAAMAGQDTIKLLTIAYPGCEDSAVQIMPVLGGVSFYDFVTDTTYCGLFVRMLGTDNANTIWTSTVPNWISPTAPTIYVSVPGTYTANASNSCGSYTQSITIEQLLPPDLGFDTTYCGAFSRVLSTGINTTTWSTGASGPSITVSSAGTYIATAVDQCGTFVDSVHVHVVPGAFNYDTAYCDGFSRTLDAGNANAIWSTGGNGSAITVNGAGLYTATITDQCGTHTDSFRIVQNEIRAVDLAASGTTVHICEQIPDTVLLHASVDSASGVPVTFVWSSGLTGPPAFGSTLVVDTEGIYQVTATRGACVVSSRPDTLYEVICDTPCLYDIAIPDAFTPNGDNKNELYKVLYSCPVTSFFIVISDRWGQTMYQSTDIDKGWDGTYKGKPQPQETYLWFICVTETPERKNMCRSGTLTLIR